MHASSILYRSAPEWVIFVRVTQVRVGGQSISGGRGAERGEGALLPLLESHLTPQHPSHPARRSPLRSKQNDMGWYEMQGVTRVSAEVLQEAAPHVFARRVPRTGEGIR